MTPSVAAVVGRGVVAAALDRADVLGPVVEVGVVGLLLAVGLLVAVLLLFTLLFLSFFLSVSLSSPSLLLLPTRPGRAEEETEERRDAFSAAAKGVA